MCSRQPTESTWQSQLAQWHDLILNYCRHYSIFRIDLQAMTAPGGSDLFENTRIKRRLSFETLQEVVEGMVGNGSAEWEGGSKGPKAVALVYWRKPEEWANLIWAWVNQAGMGNDIMTVHEIAHGELVADQPFYELDPSVLQAALNILVKRGVAQLFKGSSDDDSMGVKFFNSN
ncbi:ESCRT-II complex subunit-domain-containing protein [Dichotomocladium elegans]|nr:ESCRT-II complex subunit-domain-containing protein [Dichotomocladium elegans]